MAMTMCFSRRVMCAAHGTLTLIITVLAGISGALLAGCFLVPALTSPARGDFTVAMSLVLAGAVALVVMVTFLRRGCAR